MTRAPAFPRLVATMIATVVVLGAAAGAGAPPAAASPSDPRLQAKITTIMKDSRVTRARSAAAVRDASDGRELYTRNGDRLTTPASNTKIVTAVAALHTLGPGYRFRTEVIRRGAVRAGTLTGNLYLKGYGDPTARQSDYRSLAQQVRRAGIREVTGALVVDAGFFDSQRYNPTWSTSYAAAYYAAEISAVTIAPNADYDSGTVYLSYKPGAVGKKARISFSPAGAGAAIRLVNKTRTGKRGGSTSVSVRRAYGSSTITVRGKVAAGRSAAQRIITVHRPDLVAAAVFRAELARAGVGVGKATRSGGTPAGSRTLVARDWSMSVASLMVPFLKLSNNMHGEALTKAMGALGGRPGSWSAGLTRTRAYLARLGVPASAVRLVDGSGLTRGNRLTARGMTLLLYRVQRETWFPAFAAGLPVAGNRQRMVGGTLRYRMNGTRAANNARAKTGTLTGVTALSGYVRGRDGRRYVFAMLSEHSGASPRPVENRFVQALAGWRR